MPPKGSKKNAADDLAIAMKTEEESNGEDENETQPIDVWWKPDTAAIDALSARLAEIQRTTKTCNLVIYSDENPVPKKSKRIKEDFKKNTEILRAIEEHTGGKKMPPKTKIMILTNVYNRNKAFMKLRSKEDVDEWIKTMGVRLTNLMHHWQKLKQNPAKWVTNLINGGNTEIDHEKDKEADHEREKSDQFDGDEEPSHEKKKIEIEDP